MEVNFKTHFTFVVNESDKKYQIAGFRSLGYKSIKQSPINTDKVMLVIKRKTIN